MMRIMILDVSSLGKGGVGLTQRLPAAGKEKEREKKNGGKGIFHERQRRRKATMGHAMPTQASKV
jgi:hypothetical protein